MATTEEKSPEDEAAPTSASDTNDSEENNLTITEVTETESGREKSEEVMDLSMKKKIYSDDPSDSDDKAVKVELIQSAFEVKINELIINADKKNNTPSEDGDSCEKKATRPKRAKKRKQPPEMIIQGSKSNDYVIDQEQQYVDNTVLVIDATAAVDNRLDASIASNGELINVETVLEVETSDTATEEPAALPLKVPSVTTSATSTSLNISLAQLSSSLLSTSFMGSNGKSMRPFKLYTQNRDLLAGIGLDQNNMNSLAAALSGRPLISKTIVASDASVPVTAYAPITEKNPLIPTTIHSGVPATTISKVGSTAGSNGTLDSVEKSVETTTTPSAMRLMTLATEADKILKEKKQEKSDYSDSKRVSKESLISTDINSQVMGLFNEDGTIELTLESTSPETLAEIQRQIVTTSGELDEPVSKRSKQRQLTENVKTPTYWERRRKNNEAAKRSRDARRAKEDQIAIRAAILEHENTRLKIELKALKEETAQLRAEIHERRKADSK